MSSKIIGLSPHKKGTYQKQKKNQTGFNIHQILVYKKSLKQNFRL